jgi:hypothetical protein
MVRTIRTFLAGASLAAGLLPGLPSLSGATIQGRISDCQGGSAGLRVVGYESVLAGFGSPCQVSRMDTVTREVGSDFTGADGSYSIIFAPTQRRGSECYFDAKVSVQVFLPDGRLLWRSPTRPLQGSVTFDLLDDDANDCPQKVLKYFFDGPSMVTGIPGQLVGFEVVVFLEQGWALGSPIDPLWWGWFVTVTGDGCTVVSATTDRTAGASVEDDPPGLRCPDGGTRSLLVSGDQGICDGKPVLINVVELTSGSWGSKPVPPQDSPHAILRVTLQARIPTTGPSSCTVRLAADCGTMQSNYVIIDAEKYRPAFRDLTVRLEAGGVNGRRPLFLRGDANGDGTVDVSDAVATFGYLFLGDQEPPCQDAADANDDAALEISDGVRTLLFLFGGAEPPAGGGACNADEEPSRGCASYTVCAPPGGG